VSRSLSEKELSSINHVGEMEEKHCASLASRIFHFENPNKGTNMVFFVCCVDLNKNTEKISKPQPGLGRLSIPRGAQKQFWRLRICGHLWNSNRETQIRKKQDRNKNHFTHFHQFSNKLVNENPP
jgi:hypothetical protein